MKVAVVGSRNFKDKAHVKGVLFRLLEQNDSIITGGANGVDQWAMDYARDFGFELEVFYPDWDKYGKKAGPLRNELIIQSADLVLAFWDGTSRGTKSSIDFALKYKKELRVYFG